MILSVKKLEQTGDKIMGAYYQAVINKRKRYSTWTTTKDGSKLMEHSYMFNGYVNSVLNMMGDKPFTLDWLCDYHEPVDEWDYDWDSIEEVKSFPIKTSNGISPHYILNNTKHIYINIMELLCLYYKDNEDILVLKFEDLKYLIFNCRLNFESEEIQKIYINYLKSANPKEIFEFRKKE